MDIQDIGHLTLVTREERRGGRLVLTDTTSYLRPDRSRIERRQFLSAMPGLAAETYQHHVQIFRCDLEQQFVLDLELRRFRIFQAPHAAERRAALLAQARRSPQPIPDVTYIIETTCTDTGERRDMFGLPARRIRTVERQTPLPGSMVNTIETETEGWYADLETTLACQRTWKPGERKPMYRLTSHRKMEHPEFRHTGPRETGFALDVKTASHHVCRQAGEIVHEFSSERHVRVESLSTAEVDDALFEIPEGFERVR